MGPVEVGALREQWISGVTPATSSRRKLSRLESDRKVSRSRFCSFALLVGATATSRSWSNAHKRRNKHSKGQLGGSRNGCTDVQRWWRAEEADAAGQAALPALSNAGPLASARVATTLTAFCDHIHDRSPFNAYPQTLEITKG